MVAAKRGVTEAERNRSMAASAITEAERNRSMAASAITEAERNRSMAVHNMEAAKNNLDSLIASRQWYMRFARKAVERTDAVTGEKDRRATVDICKRKEMRIMARYKPREDEYRRAFDIAEAKKKSADDEYRRAIGPAVAKKKSADAGYKLAKGPVQG